MTPRHSPYDKDPGDWTYYDSIPMSIYVQLPRGVQLLIRRNFRTAKHMTKDAIELYESRRLRNRSV